MHIAVSAEARKRANREFRAIVLRIPSFDPSRRSPRVSHHPPPYLTAISSFRSSRFQFRPWSSQNISPLCLHTHTHIPLSLPPFSPSLHVTLPTLFRFYIYIYIYPPAYSLFSSFPHARRQLYDATNCSRVYRHIIITRKLSTSIIRVRDLIRFAF